MRYIPAGDWLFNPNMICMAVEQSDLSFLTCQCLLAVVSFVWHPNAVHALFEMTLPWDLMTRNAGVLTECLGAR